MDPMDTDDTDTSVTESVSDRDAFLHLWQRRNVGSETHDLPQTADTMRFNFAQLRFLRKTFSDISDDSIGGKSSELLQLYGRLMDKAEKEGGLNNYADPILVLIGNSKNESKTWTSNLNAKEMMDKHLKPNLKANIIPETEYQHLADLFNKAPDWKAPEVGGGSLTGTKPKTQPAVLHQEQENAFYNDYSDDWRTGNSKNQASVRTASQTPDQQRSQNWKPNQGASTSSGRGMAGREGKYPWNRGGRGGNNQASFGGPAQAPPTHRAGSAYSGGAGEPSRHSDRGRRGRQMSNRPLGGRGNYPWHRGEEAAGGDGGQGGAEARGSCFKTASHQMLLEQQKKFGRGGGGGGGGGVAGASYGSGARSLGIRKSVGNKFVPPVRREDEYGGDEMVRRCMPQGSSRGSGGEDSPYADLLTDPRLVNIDAKMVELIMNEIMDNGLAVAWDDIAGLKVAKTTIQEVVVWPMLRPDIFTGLRGPPKGILLFGPPGTGKTMIGKCIACQSGSTFFSISASSLTSKWVGEGEKMVRAMFAVARCHQPSVIFIDEIDSLLSQRSDSEHESSRRIKTEFLIQLDGATTESEERLLVVGATNRPQELDEAARRRLVKKLYIPLPDEKARQQIIERLMSSQSHTLDPEGIERVCNMTDGYSGADMANLCREAALGPIRSISFDDIHHIAVDQVRPISLEDFVKALSCIKASVSDTDLHMYEEWNRKFGITSR